MDPYGQALPDAAQTAAIVEFLNRTLGAGDAAADDETSVVDDEANELELRWDRGGRRLAVLTMPVRNRGAGVVGADELAEYEQDPTLMLLRREDVEELVRFLGAGPG
jgi:hypothetical protein